MERILFGDNQFFAVNHISDEKSMAQSIRFKEDAAIIKTLDVARNNGVNTFMCTTHDRIERICTIIRSNPVKYETYNMFPCLPYAHKYANSITENGVLGTFQKFVPGNMVGSLLKGGMAVLSRDYMDLMELMIDSELKMFKGLHTPVIFLQNVVTDLLLGLRMTDFLVGFHRYIKMKYNAEAGFITMNMPMLVDVLESAGIRQPIICTSINKAGFRMSGGMSLYEKVLQEDRARIIAMQILAGGAVPVSEAIEYVSSLPGISSLLFGASSKTNIEETVSYIHHFDQMYTVPKNVPIYA
jgi:hypothetical protein